MGDAKTPDAPSQKPPRPALPAAASIFEVGSSSGGSSARAGKLMGSIPTPAFTIHTSRGLPLILRPEVLAEQLPGQQLMQVPIGDLVLPQEVVSHHPDRAVGCRSIWPHMKGQLAYASFRNPRLNNGGVHGGDAVLSVETTGGRRKMGPRNLLDCQRVMRADIVAAPGEEVPCDVSSHRRVNRAVGRAAEWLRDVLEAKASEPELAFDWHVLASVQGGADEKAREKAAVDAAAMPVAGFWIGGLGYSESLSLRATVLKTVMGALPEALPRFLPLSSGSPLEVLQAVLLGVDVLEIPCPVIAAQDGTAFTFSWELSEAEADALPEPEKEALAALLPQEAALFQAASSIPVARQLQLRTEACREDFGPISPDSPVKQYSRAYLFHLFQVRELLGTMLLTEHNLHVYTGFFEAVRAHARRGTLRKYAAWFLREQTGPAPEAPIPNPTAKRRRHA